MKINMGMHRVLHQEWSKAGKRAGHVSREERLRTPGLPSLEKRRLRGHPRALCNSLRRGSTEEVQPLLLSPTMGCMGRAQRCARRESDWMSGKIYFP